MDVAHKHKDLGAWPLRVTGARRAASSASLGDRQPLARLARRKPALRAVTLAHLVQQVVGRDLRGLVTTLGGGAFATGPGVFTTAT